MANKGSAGLFRIVDFDWPQPFKPEYGIAARALHEAVQNQSWIKEIAALDKLFRDQNDPIGTAYRAFF